MPIEVLKDGPTVSSCQFADSSHAETPLVDINSNPPATTLLACPTLTWFAASAIASNPEAQKRVRVIPGTVAGNPALSDRRRAIFIPCIFSGNEHPKIKSSIDAGSKDPPTRCNTPSNTCFPISSGLSWAK